LCVTHVGVAENRDAHGGHRCRAKPTRKPHNRSRRDDDGESKGEEQFLSRPHNVGCRREACSRFRPTASAEELLIKVTKAHKQPNTEDHDDKGDKRIKKHPDVRRNAGPEVFFFVLIHTVGATMIVHGTALCANPRGKGSEPRRDTTSRMDAFQLGRAPLYPRLRR
jgi:hypothetical protein